MYNDSLQILNYMKNYVNDSGSGTVADLAGSLQSTDGELFETTDGESVEIL